MQRIEQPTAEQLAKRKANLERKQRQRAREKARSLQAMNDHLERVKGDRMNAEGIARRTKRNESGSWWTDKELIRSGGLMHVRRSQPRRGCKHGRGGS